MPQGVLTAQPLEQMRELRAKRAELTEMIFKNEVIIRDMEEVLRRASEDSATLTMRDASCGTAEDFRENWSSTIHGGFLSHPEITLEKLDAMLDEETRSFQEDRLGFVEEIRQMQESCHALRSIVQSRLQ
jgi:hypothetical protein